MDNSNCGCECSFVKSGFCKTDRECPFYVETLWQKEGDPVPKIVKDCSPKKMMVEQNALLHRMLCTQSVVEDVRNRMDKLEQMLAQLISQSKEFILEKKFEKIESRQEKFQQLPMKKDDV